MEFSIHETGVDEAQTGRVFNDNILGHTYFHDCLICSTATLFVYLDHLLNRINADCMFFSINDDLGICQSFTVRVEFVFSLLVSHEIL